MILDKTYRIPQKFPYQLPCKEDIFTQIPPVRPELLLPSVLTSQLLEINALVSNTSKTIYFTQASSATGARFLMMTKFRKGQWQDPEIHPLSNMGTLSYGAFNFVQEELLLTFQKGGTNAFSSIISIRPDAFRNNRQATRTLIGHPSFNFGSPSISQNQTVYFHADGPVTPGVYHLYKIVQRNGKVSEPIILSVNINIHGNIFHPCIAPDESFIIYDSAQIPGRVGRHDLFLSFNLGGGKWTDPINLGPKINSPSSDYSATLSSDGSFLIFSSDRPVPNNNSRNLYWVSTDFISDLREDYL